MICNGCGREASSRPVEIRQNIGLILLRLHKESYGCFCKECIRKRFWPMTGTTLVLGWWGIISLLITPFILISNTYYYLTSFTLKKVPPNAVIPRINRESVGLLLPYMEDIMNDLRGPNPKEAVAAEYANKSNLTPAQVMMIMELFIKKFVSDIVISANQRQSTDTANKGNSCNTKAEN